MGGCRMAGRIGVDCANRAENANDLPVGEVVSTRGDGAGVLPENYYDGAESVRHGEHDAIIGAD